MKFKIGDVVYFIKDNRIHSGMVFAYNCSNYENYLPYNSYNESVLDARFTRNVERYGVKYGDKWLEFNASDLFPSREALLDYLTKDIKE